MNGLFQTSSLNIVAFLMSHNFNYKDLKRIDGQTIFYYDRNEDLQKIIQLYNTNIELKKFISCFKKVKDVVKA